ncbi:Inner membrane protein YciS [Candidatus Arsenophonus lipoptenae]|uniref:Lipopolysaccharide assembly protein A n=1 Tax=Candidatus Arsenophonus lipoptenae TaxID=634113 RepID=A0A0X8CX98_9GAMM|nr:lipopolysaccharide assembly protein LapA domain-containing protein [Candidatus Arsenophonus lipoptenae]AMA64647.1 Inner membrane protein YciS [Candidatus Arsenophonus lipoptenae]
MKYFLILLFIIAVFIISMIFGSSNNQIITFNFLIAKGDYPISTLLAILFTIGFILGCLICGIFYIKTLIVLSHAKRKIKRLENKLAELG